MHRAAGQRRARGGWRQQVHRSDAVAGQGDHRIEQHARLIDGGETWRPGAAVEADDIEGGRQSADVSVQRAADMEGRPVEGREEGHDIEVGAFGAGEAGDEIAGRIADAAELFIGPTRRRRRGDGENGVLWGEVRYRGVPWLGCVSGPQINLVVRRWYAGAWCQHGGRHVDLERGARDMPPVA